MKMKYKDVLKSLLKPSLREAEKKVSELENRVEDLEIWEVIG